MSCLSRWERSYLPYTTMYLGTIRYVPHGTWEIVVPDSVRIHTLADWVSQELIIRYPTTPHTMLQHTWIFAGEGFWLSGRLHLDTHDAGMQGFRAIPFCPLSGCMATDRVWRALLCIVLLHVDLSTLMHLADGRGWLISFFESLTTVTQ